MRSLLLPLTERAYERFLLENAKNRHVISMLGETPNADYHSEVHCGFYGLVRMDNDKARYWERPAESTYFFTTERESEELLSGLPKPNRIAMVQGAFAQRYEELCALCAYQRKRCPYGDTGDLIGRIEALDDACSREIRRIVLS